MMAWRIKRYIAVFSLGMAFVLLSQHARAAGPPDGYRTLPSKSTSFVIYYPPHLLKMAQEIDKLLEESSVEMAAQLGIEKITPIRVYLASSEKTYRDLVQGAIPEWSAAFSELRSQILGINVDAVLRSPRPLAIVVRHELSHLLLAQRVGNVTVPTWFMEGLAMIQAHEWTFADEWHLMTMVGRRNFPYLEQLSGPFPGPADKASLSYGLSYVAVEELLRDRPDALMTLTAFLRDTGDFSAAFMSTFGQTPYDFGSRLYVTIYKKYKAPGVILNSAPYWLGFALLFVSVYLIKRVRTRRTLEQWEEDEARRSRFWC